MSAPPPDPDPFDFSRLVPEEFRLPRRPGYDAILAEARRLADDFGEALTLDTFLDQTQITHRDIRLWFVTWSKLRLAAGLSARPPRPDSGPTAAQMTAALCRIAEDEGPDVTQARFCVLTRWSSMLVQRRFGTFAALRESAGLPPRPALKKRVTREALAADIARVWVSLGRPEPFFPVSTYDRHGRHSRSTIYQRFESWKQAETAARAIAETLP